MPTAHKQKEYYQALIGSPPTQVNHLTLKAAWIDTKLGSMLAIADEKNLYLLEFVDGRGLKDEVKRLKQKLKTAIIPGETAVIKNITSELTNYFNGQCMAFKTSIHLMGSPFQQSVWHTLQKIPPGETRAYLDIAKSINAPTACRAVASAIGANPLAIIVPCHRVINTNGTIGGYAGGIARKQQLLEHEKNSTTIIHKKRCAWCSDDPLYIVYHDTEWGVPIYDDNLLFEFLILEGMQAGLSWLTILKKRNAFREAFDHFDAKRIAKYNQHKVEQLLKNENIIRNKLKIQAAINNAKCFLEVKNEWGNFSDYIWHFVNRKPIIHRWKSISKVPTKTTLSDTMSKDLKKRGFKFVGSTICYAFMQATGMVNDHTLDCFKSS